MNRYCYICGYKTTDDNINECPQCLCDDVFVKSKDEEELMMLFNDRDLTNAMLKLKKKDPIEYQLKLNQFKLQQEQSDVIREQERESNRPHCPTCGSTNIKKITGTERAVSVIGLGIFSKKINKSYKCLKCKSTW